MALRARKVSGAFENRAPEAQSRGGGNSIVSEVQRGRWEDENVVRLRSSFSTISELLPRAHGQYNTKVASAEKREED